MAELNNNNLASSGTSANDVYTAVNTIRTAILQSQARAVKAANQEQLALYYGIGRFISANTRNKNWGNGVIEGISKQLSQELPGLRGFGVRQLKNMRNFYEQWSILESNSAITNANLESNSAIAIAELQEMSENDCNTIRQLQLAKYVNYIMQDFRQPMGVATYKTADEVDPELVKLLPPKEELIKLLVDGKED